MSHSAPNDGLLKAARVLVILIQIVLAIVVAGLVIAIPVVFFSQSHVAEILAPDATAGLGGVVMTIATLLAMAAAMAGISFHFFQLLNRIVSSVGEGDPFNIANADRLTRMGWIAVIIEVIKFPLGGLAVFLSQQIETEKFDLDLGFSLTGILIALLLFILARVFRHGAAMREDLEGTV